MTSKGFKMWSSST